MRVALCDVGLPHAHIMMRPRKMPTEFDGRGNPGDARAWVDELVCAKKPTIDVLVEYGLLDDDATVAQHILEQPFAMKKRLFPKAKLNVRSKLNPSVQDVMEEMQSLVTGERKCMDGYGTMRSRGPMEHGPYPFHDERPANFCKKAKDGSCKVW